MLVYCVKMCDINGQAFTTKFQKRKWQIKTAVINSVECVPHVWHILSVTYTVRQSYGQSAMSFEWNLW
jgi:hypothetical protein